MAPSRAMLDNQEICVVHRFKGEPKSDFSNKLGESSVEDPNTGGETLSISMLLLSNQPKTSSIGFVVLLSGCQEFSCKIGL